MVRSSAVTPWATRLMAGRGWYYGWLIVAVTLLAAMASSGLRMASSVMVKPLEAEFGWDRAAVSLALAVGLLANGLGAPFGGRLIDRFGPRRVLLGCTGVVLVSTVGTIFMSTLAELSLWWGLALGVATGPLAGVLGPVVANRWFVARRGLVTGLLSGGASAGQLVFIPVLMALTVGIDWRAALWLMVGLFGLVILPLGLLAMRDDPASVGQRPYGAAGPSDAGVSGPLTSIRAAARTLDFWLLAGSFYLCGFTSVGLIGTHFIPHAVEHGFTPHQAAGAMSAIGALNVIGTTVSGVLTDRYNPRLLLAMFYGLRSTSLLLLPLVGDLSGLTVFAIVFGFDFVATVPPTVLLAADRFGKRSVGAIYGWIFLSHQVGSATASYAGGLVRVWLGDYQVAFVAAGLLGLVAALLALRVSAARPTVAAAPA